MIIFFHHNHFFLIRDFLILQKSHCLTENIFFLIHMIKTNHAFAKYPPVSDKDAGFGIYITTCGYSVIQPGSKYPPLDHPSSYIFTWEKGRILSDYQIIYITAGEGIFEGENYPLSHVSPGTIIFLFPGAWHRYKPLPEKGWTEYWIGFSGTLVHLWEKKEFLLKKQPILCPGIHEHLIDRFINVCNTVESEKPAFQQMASGELLAILGWLYAFPFQKQYDGSEPERIINMAKAMMHEKIYDRLSPASIARELNMSYSRFRKVFKEYTGMAPAHYFLHLKIQKARELAASTSMPFKEISDRLGFDNNFYFSRMFKHKTGMSPATYRKIMQEGKM